MKFWPISNITMNLSGQPVFVIIFQMPSWLTVSKRYLCQDNECHVKVYALFLAFLLELACCENHIYYIAINIEWLEMNDKIRG